MADENVKVNDSSILPVLEKLVIELKKKPELEKKNLVLRLVPSCSVSYDYADRAPNTEHDVYYFGEEIEQVYKGIFKTKKTMKFTNTLFRLRVPDEGAYLQISFGERSLQDIIHANLKDYAVKYSLRLNYDDKLRIGSFIL